MLFPIVLLALCLTICAVLFTLLRASAEADHKWVDVTMPEQEDRHLVCYECGEVRTQ